MYIPRTPNLIQKVFSSVLFRVHTKEKIVYLSFDDGPHPIVTPYVLDLLNQYQCKASFFVIGSNVEKYPEIISQIKANNHTIGNHSFSHLNAYKVSNSTYLADIKKADKTLSENGIINSFFRPPYGRLTWNKFRQIKTTKKIVLWDIISEDYSQKSPEKLFEKIKRQTRPGSIIVFHDSEKCFENLQKILPNYLEFLKKEGYLSKAIQENY